MPLYWEHIKVGTVGVKSEGCASKASVLPLSPPCYYFSSSKDTPKFRKKNVAANTQNYNYDEIQKCRRPLETPTNVKEI